LEPFVKAHQIMLRLSELLGRKRGPPSLELWQFWKVQRRKVVDVLIVCPVLYIWSK
jgi:hypothetical protein